MVILSIVGAVILSCVVFYFIFRTTTSNIDRMVEDEQIHTYYKPHKKCCGGSCHTVVVASNCPNDVWNAGGVGGYGEVGVALDEDEPLGCTEIVIDTLGLAALDAAVSEPEYPQQQVDCPQAEVNKESDFSSLQTEESYVDTSSNDICSNDDSDSCSDSGNDD